MSTLIGLDIGTTSISAVAVRASDGQVLRAVTVPNPGAAPAAGKPPHTQDSAAILRTVFRLKEELTAQYAPLAAIGLTGQMHGILYLDRTGQAVSPLYTWQDPRGELPWGDGTYASVLSRECGYPLSSGYGLLTHFINRQQGLVPPEAAAFSTIADYAAMRLCGLSAPLLHASNAASLGCFSLSRGAFDKDALRHLGVSHIPDVSGETAVLGRCGGVPVALAIGDNQASVLGALGAGGVLVNIGTGSQISAVADAPCAFPAGEVRPYVDGRFLLVGAPLCGGRAYALLHRFFARCAACFGDDGRDVYAAMNALAAQDPQHHTLAVDPRFCGTRADPALRGAIRAISEDNFTPEELIRGVLWGMADELHSLYREMPLAASAHTLVVSGNAVRENPVLRQYLAQQFALPLRSPVHREEAAFGAAVFAAAAAGIYPDTEKAQNALVHLT